MNGLIILIKLTCLLLLLASGGSNVFGSAYQQASAAGNVESVEKALNSVAQRAPEAQQEESYQRVYEAFSKLMQNMSQNSLVNVRRLVSRLNQLVGTPTTGGANNEASKQQQEQIGKEQQSQVSNKEQQTSGSKPSKSVAEQNMDDKTEQILNRLDKVNKTTDQNTLHQLNEDVSRLIGTLNDSYLRNIRRVIERVNRVVGQPAISGAATATTNQQLSNSDSNPNSNVLHQADLPDRIGDPHDRVPGFPGWDELIVAVDRMQKSLATFVRSSTRLITSG